MKTHVLNVRVRYGDTDRMGVVYYANYFHFFEAGRTEYLRALGTDYRSLEEQGVYFPVSEATCRYFGPARYDDELEVVTWVSRLRPTRIDFDSVVRRRGETEPVAAGRVVLACVDAGRRPVRIPPAVREGIELCEPAPGLSMEKRHEP